MNTKQQLKCWALAASVLLLPAAMLKAQAAKRIGTYAMKTVRKAESGPIVLWVSPDGNDEAEGTKEAPLATLQQALLNVRQMRQTAEEGTLGEMHIVLRGGTYRLTSTLTLTAEDSGTPTSPTIIEAAEGERPVLSGGVTVGGWQSGVSAAGLPATAQGQVWSAPVNDLGVSESGIRQMWIGNTKMRRASTLDDLSLPRLISVDKAKGELTVPLIRQAFSHPEGIELTIIQDWAMNHLRVKTLVNDGERSRLTFMDPESSIEFKRPWPILRADETSFSNHHFYLSNAIELLNRPQEWYHDAESHTLYYWPREGEDASTIEAVVPTLETLISVEGTVEAKVTNLQFRGITFEHTTWMRPSEAGHVALQAGQWLYDAYSDDTAPGGNVAWVGRPSAAVSVKDASDVTFSDCRFEHVGSTALDFVSGTKQTSVQGCVFNDVGGTAILAGYFGDETFEAHKAYNPDDERVVCDGVVIDNNYITNVGTDDWGCVGIGIGFASNVSITHNEICHTPYSAISMGWGWTKESSCMHDNHIVGNYIHHFSRQMRDGGAIYTLSAQSNSSIEENRIESVGDPLLNPVMWDMRHSQFDLYTDEGSDYFTVNNNWLERGEISKNQNGSHNQWGANGSNVSTAIKEAAGLEADFLALRESVAAPALAPLDSIGDDNSGLDRIEFVAQNEGFKLGTMLAVDLNNDNRLDIVYGGGESFQVQHGGVRMNMGQYSFAATQGLKRLYMSNFAAGDLNGDGFMDLVQAGWDFWGCYNAVLLNDGKGSLSQQPLTTSKNTSPACGIADIDNNGLPDYFFVGNGQDNSFYLQRHDRTFAEAASRLSLPGGFSDPNMVYADFNNDQSIDIILLSNRDGGVYTRLFLNNGTGKFTETDAGLTERGTRGGMAYADVNNDGFLDLAVGGMFYGEQWNSTAADGGKTVTVYLNNQHGQFTKQQELSEYMFDNVTQPLRFCDWDNDGNTDLIVTGWNMSEGNVSRTDVFLNDGEGNFTKIDAGLPGVSEGAIELADFGGSGANDILISGNCNGGYNGFSADRRIAVLCRNHADHPHTAPVPPTSLTAEVSDLGTVTLRWEAGDDAETPVSALSYNYYLRDVNSGLYLTFSNADLTTGQRRVSQMGNAWLNRQWTLHLPAGTYAWSVQTVDAAYAGSPFATEQTFTIDEGAEELETIAYPEPKTQFKPVTNLEDGTEYAMQNANETLAKRNLYWEWGQYLRTQSSGTMDDVTFIAHKKDIAGQTFWSFQITSATGKDRYIGRVNNAGNIGITDTETLWQAVYVESETEEGDGFTLLLRGDTPDEGHELTMNGSADWVCCYLDGQTIDKTANTTHWQFFRTADLNASALSDYNQKNLLLYQYLIETLQMNDRGITSMLPVYKAGAAIYNRPDNTLADIEEALATIQSAIAATTQQYTLDVPATYGILNPSFENVTSQHDHPNAAPFGWTLTRNGTPVTGHNEWAWFGANGDGNEKDGDYIWGIWNGSNYGEIELSQTLTGLPNGTYEVSARMMQNNTETGNMARLFAADQSQMPGPADAYTTLPAGENVTFADGWATSDRDMSHVLSVRVTVTDGTLTFGVRANGFFKVDDFRLTWLGDTSVGIQHVNGTDTVVTPIYNLSGQRLRHRQQGINIQSGQKILVR